MKKFLLFISLIIFFTCHAAAQAEIDSLKKAIKGETNISARADLILKLCEKYRDPNSDSCLAYAKLAIGLLKVIDDPARISKAEWYITYYYYVTGSPDSAFAIAQKNIDWLKDKRELQPLLAQYYSSSGICLMKLDKKKDALDRFYIALQTAERCDDIRTQLKAYVNIAWVMMELYQFEQAIINLNKAVDFINKNKMQVSTAVIYGNLASSYGSLDKTDSAYKYANIAIETARRYNDPISEANGFFILGKAQQKKKQLQEALQSFLKGIALREKTGDKVDPFFIVADLSELSILYAEMGNTKEGIATAQQALEIAEKNNITAKMPMVYAALGANYEANKDFEKAVEVYKKANDLKDSAYADASPRAVAEMEAKYETEKKERVIEKQHNKLVRQNILFIGLGLILISKIWLGWSIYKRYKQKKESQLHAMMMKQQELAAKAVIEAEEEERQRIARDLHDGVGQMMSAVKMNLSAFESEMKFDSSEQKKSFQKIIELVDDSCKEVRQVSHNMMPNSLLKSNLSSALNDFINKIDKKTIEIHLYTEGLDERIDSNVESMLYRIIQECVNNAIKHAGATTLDISVIRDNDGISATVEDNGKGFDTTDREKFEGIGLKNIRTRVEYLKGAVEFDSAPGRGTAIGLHVVL